jgi:hypothetical protein
MSQTDIEDAIRLYGAGNSVHEIGEMLGFRGNLVWSNLRRAGVLMRNNYESSSRRPANDAAFSEPLTEKGRYFIGLLMADGCVQQRSANGFSISLGLCAEDVAMVEALRDFACPTAPIEHRSIPTGDSRTVRVASRQMADDLARYGVVPNKSLTAKASGGVELDRDFWRGVIDGDGHFSRHFDGNYSIGLCGSLDILRQFSAYCSTVIPDYAAPVSGTARIFRTSIYGRKAQMITSALYEGCTIALERKWSVAREIMASVPRATNRPLVYSPQRV